MLPALILSSAENAQLFKFTPWVPAAMANFGIEVCGDGNTSGYAYGVGVIPATGLSRGSLSLLLSASALSVFGLINCHKLNFTLL